MKKVADLLVDHAEREAEQSRQRLLATIAEIRLRIDPRAVAAETAENALAGANRLLDDAKTAVRDRPAISAGAGAAFAIAVGLRMWLSKPKVETDAT